MSKQQNKRVYNLAFAFAALCSAYFVFCGERYILEEQIIPWQHEELVKMHDPDWKGTFYQVLACQRRIRFMEENGNGIAVAGTFLTYVVLYFGLWQIGSLSVRYVKGKPNDQPLESSKT